MLDKNVSADVASAMQVLVTCLNNHNAMEKLAIFFLSRYPELAREAAGLEPLAEMVRISVPPTNGWNRVVIDAPLQQVNNWMALYNAEAQKIHGGSPLVAAIKQVRNDTDLGLKDAKDLMEYLVRHGVK